MSELTSFLLSERFGWLLAYTFGYGLFALPIAWLIHVATKKFAPELRYNILLLLLAATASAPIVGAINTVLVESSPPPAVAITDTQLLSSQLSTSVDSEATPDFSPAQQQQRHIAPTSIIRWLPLIWCLGAVATALCVGVGLLGTKRLIRSSTCIPEALQRLQNSLSEDFALLQKIPILISDRIISPVLVGLLKPVILLPAAASGWDEETFRFVVLHELAHVRRWDNLANFIQRLVEVVLFFQPALWLVSHWVRTEREVCCDRFVVNKTGSPKGYARTLFQMAQHTPNSFHQLATTSMARQSIVHRITRVLNKEEPMKVSFTWSLVVCAGIAFALCLFVPASTADESNAGQEPTPERSDNTAAADTDTKALPSKSTSEKQVINGVEVGRIVGESRQCKFEAERIEIRTRARGTISSIAVEAGTEVKKGQVIAELDSAILRSELAELDHKAKSTILVDFATVTVEQEQLRLSDMIEKIQKAGGVVFTAYEIREQEFQIQKAKAELKKATEDKEGVRLAAITKREQLANYTMVSPSDGIVTSVAAHQGAAVADLTTVAEIVSQSDLSMFVKFENSQSTTSVRLGDVVRFTPDDTNLQPIFGRVVKIDNARSTVLCQMKNPREIIREGTMGTATFFEPAAADRTQAVDEKQN